MVDNSPEYQALLNALAITHPTLSAVLVKAQNNRSSLLQRYQSGARLKGLEDLLTHIREVEESYLQTEPLIKLAFLVERVKADFESAIEAGLTGLRSIVADTMRDVMEIEMLLRDFLHEPELDFVQSSSLNQLGRVSSDQTITKGQLCLPCLMYL